MSSPSNKPKPKPSGTDSVSKKQSFQEWAMAGGGVPLQYKGREHVWDRKVKQYAEGGGVDMAGGGISRLLKGLKGTQEILPAAQREANLQRMLAESKTPMRLYHGTTATEGGKGTEAIRNIRPSKEGSLGSGTYLTPKAAQASGYSGIPNDEAISLMAGHPSAKNMADQFMADRASGTVREGQVGGNMLPVYAQIKNPLIIDGGGDPMIEALIKLGMDEGKASRMVERAYDQKGYIGKEVQQRAQAQGYDGLMQYRNGDLSEVVTYKPGAVKSAIGNRGTYDMTDPDLNKAAGGSINMAGGGIAKLLKAAKTAKEAPAVVVPSRLSELQAEVAQKSGQYGAKRVQRAADEVKNLERLYTPDALRQVFLGDNAKALVTMNPADFEKYAKKLEGRTRADIGPKSAELAKQGQIDKYTVPTDEYIQHLMRVQGGFDDVPYLNLRKDETGLPMFPNVTGHEGRHRSRALAEMGEPSSLVNIQPSGGLREELPRRSREEFIEALRKELDLKDRMVIGEDNINVLRLPDVYAEGGEVGKGGAAFGTFPQMKPRRAKQDREAAKNVPVDLARGFVSGVLGAPGDIESFARLPYELITGKDSPTFLPRSEDIEKRLPFRSEAPVSRAASGAGQLAGGFYMGPGSPLRAVGALPGAIKHGAQEFAKASAAAAPRVVKPKGGNWLGDQNASGVVENQLRRLKMGDSTDPEYVAGRMQRLEEAKAAGDDRTVRAIEADLDVSRRNDAINSWIEGNLKNYVKKDMGTEGDPVRKLAEQGILHMEPYGTREAGSLGMRKRAGLGYPAQGMGQSETAKFWERLSDASIDAYPAGSYKYGALDEGLLKANPWLERVPDEQMIYSGKGLSNDLGFDHIIDVLRQDAREGRIRPEQLSKVSMEQAVRRTYDYDQEMAKKMREAQIKNTEGMPVHKEYPEGYKWIELAPSKELPEGWTTKNGAYYSPEGQRQVHPDSERLGSALKYEGETMGHCVGGYCPDVLEGRSRIYSLRDAKGEPHVTVEVQPSGILKDEDFGAADVRILEGRGEFGEKGYKTSDDEFFEVYADAVSHEKKIAKPNLEASPSIVQIKGKQNRAPNEQYLPFVQDFVRGGKWSDVGDFKNTGLIRKSDLIDRFGPDDLDAIGKGEYLTKGEYDDLLLKALKPEGMKAGGPVKMAGGGAIKEALKKLLKPGAEAATQEVTAAERAAAGRKAAELIKSQPQVKASEALGQAMEKGFKKTTTTQADRTRVGGGNIGGAPFSAISEVDPAYAGKVWGVMDEGTAARLKNLTDPETAWTTMLGSANQLKTNPIVFEKLKKGFLESMKAGNLKPELEAKINHNLALTFGDGASIRDPKIWKEADTFEKRAALADLMMGQGIAPGKGGVALGGEKSGKGVIFKPTDILKRETESGLLHPEHGGSAPTFAAGPRLFSMDPVSDSRPDLHPGFPTLIRGKDLGTNMIPTPTEIYLPEWHSRFKKANPDRKGPGYYDLALGVKGEGLPSQDLNDPYIRHLIREGFKAGGAVSGLSTVNKLCGCHD